MRKNKTKNKTLTQASRNAAQSITSFWLFPEIALSFLMRIIVPVLDYKTSYNSSPFGPHACDSITSQLLSSEDGAHSPSPESGLSL